MNSKQESSGEHSTTVFPYKKSYKRLRESNPKWFSGKVHPEQVDAVAALVEKHKPKSLLDFGSGAGYQYLADRIHDRWGGLLPVCYDPGVDRLSEEPPDAFDGVICIDVLEHIHPSDLSYTTRQILSHVNPGGFAYFLICCHPAHKTFPDGRNVHLTIRNPSFWRMRMNQLRIRYSKITIEDEYEWFPGSNSNHL